MFKSKAIYFEKEILNYQYCIIENNCDIIQMKK